MKVFKKFFILALILSAGKLYCQILPYSYQAMMKEIVVNFETIRSGNSISQGNTTLSVLNEDKIALRVEHKKQDKNLTFVTKPDEEGNLVWVAANEQTTDMVNKYEDYLTDTLKSMLKLSEKKSKE
jgi:hypothetical protein